MDDTQVLMAQAIANVSARTHGTFETEELLEALQITKSYDELLEAMDLTVLESYKKVKNPETRKELLLNHAKEVHKKQSKVGNQLLNTMLGACDLFGPDLFGLKLCEESQKSTEDDGAIKIWRFADAPEKYKSIIEQPEKVEWVAFVPAAVYDYEDGHFGFLLEGTFGSYSVKEYSLVESSGDGALFVGSRK